MTDTSTIIGLSVIIIAWVVQLVYSWKGKKEIQTNFIIIYALGTGLLIIDCYLNDLRWTGIFNTIILMISLIVLIKAGSTKEVKKEVRTVKRNSRRR